MVGSPVVRIAIVSKHVLKDKWLLIISYESTGAYVRQTKVVCASKQQASASPPAARAGRGEAAKVHNSTWLQIFYF